MKRVLFAAFAVALASASPVFAQALVPAAQADAANANLETVARESQRVLQLVQSITSDPRFQTARTPRDRGAFLAEKAEAIAAARIELQAIAARLSAIPKVAGALDAASLQLADRSLENAAVFASGADRILANMEEFSAALTSGDRRRIEASSNAMMASSALLLDYQAVVFRSGQAMHAAGSTNHARNAALACYYEGAGAYMRGAAGLIPASEGAAKVRAAADCLRSEVAAGRAALARDSASPEEDFKRRMVAMQLRGVAGELFGAVESGAPHLDQIANELQRRGASPALAGRYLPVLMDIERQVLRAQEREGQIIQEANRTR
jgi:hypothetical protein